MRSQQVFVPYGAHTSRADLATAQTITVPAGAEFMMMQALTQNVRFRLDKTSPTASVGFQLAAGDTIMLPVAPGDEVRVIQEAATASLQYQFGIGGF